MAKKKKKAENVKPEIPLDVQQSIIGVEPKLPAEAEKEKEVTEAKE